MTRFTHTTCSCGCGATASKEYLDSLDRVFKRAGLNPGISSMVRCRPHNKKIGGSIFSAHVLTADPGEFGATDLKIKPVARSKGGNAKQAYKIIKAAQAEGFNVFEVCNQHIHIGKVPENHPMANTIYWGVSQ